ncbi:hypothetical protein HQQ80_05440 [Microbacteriaceae bacterium VKM Ac-2855]|nr:hypothetical protein [Microbacteriaceae bacterium VKM Ac-2855]
MRAPLYVLFAAIAPLNLASFVTADGVRDLMPLAALDISGAPAPASVLAALGWLLLVAAAAYLSGRRRALLG